MADVATTAAVQARYWAQAGPGKPQGGPYSVGYSQPDRLNVYRDSDEAGWLTRDTNADCGTLVMGAINYGLHQTYPALKWGHPVLFDLDDYWTGNLRGGLEARGFTEVPWNDADLYPQGGFRVGDVVLSAGNEGGVGHVCMVTAAGGGSEILVSEAWIAEDGSIDGYAGDTTGSETRTVAYATHLDTARGAWTSCHRFDPALFAQQHPDCVEGTASPAPAPAPVPPSPPSGGKPGPLLGVDISNWQAGIDLAAVNPDFVIVKVTQDAGAYATSNPNHVEQINAALALGRPTGVYHYVGGGDNGNADDALAEANRFLDAVRATGHQNDVFYAIDWESIENSAWGNTSYLSIIVGRVQSATGKPVLLYASASSYPWQVAQDYGCVPWVAQYADMNPTGWDSAPWSDGSWSTDGRMHQYTGTGRVPGYGGDLDLDVWHASEAALRSLAPSGGPVASAPSVPRPRATAPDGQELLVVDGEWGSRTVARFQQVMGTPIDGVLDDDGSTCIEAFQRFLNGVVGSAHLSNLIGAPALEVDGVDGERTWKAFQFLVWCWHREYVPADWGWGDWIDGVDGPATVMALQRALNVSTAGTGRLW